MIEIIRKIIIILFAMNLVIHLKVKQCIKNYLLFMDEKEEVQYKVVCVGTMIIGWILFIVYVFIGG